MEFGMGQCMNATIDKDPTPWCMMEPYMQHDKELTALCEMQPNSFEKEALRRIIRAALMTKKPPGEFCTHYHAK
jgi:hypothetical protein